MSRNLLLSIVVAALAAASGTAASGQAFDRITESSPGTQGDSAAGAAEIDTLDKPLPQKDEPPGEAPTAGESEMPAREPDSGPADEILASIAEEPLRLLAQEVLERNPEIAAARARSRAAEQRAPQVRVLPDPVAGLTGFLKSPETRVGPQRLMASVSQTLPWLSKLALKEQAAVYEAAALEQGVEARRLGLLTEARRLYYELGFLDQYQEITEDFLDHLRQHEEIARARYSTGVGLAQGVVKLQAEITRVENRLLSIDTRRTTIVAALNALRDQPATTQLPIPVLPRATNIALGEEKLLAQALAERPELAAADARIGRAETLLRRAKQNYRPDFKVGLSYTLVDPREDLPGRLQPPEDNGKDIFGVHGGISLPIWRKKLAAGVEEALELERGAKEAKRSAVARIEASVGDLTQRIPLTLKQTRLLEDIFILQAEEAVESTKAGYIAGTLNALDLFDAEHVLFEAQTAAARSRADYAVAVAQLEGAVGGPLHRSKE